MTGMRDRSTVVFLYGPPAAGKYTTGRALSELTGFGLFHNHLTVDAVRPVFPEEGEWRSRALQTLRHTMLSLAAEAGESIIFTLAYSGAVDDTQVARMVEGVEEHDGRVCFVRLHAPVEELLLRVESEGRRAMRKIHDRERLQARLRARDHFATVQHEPHLKLTTPDQTPEQAARLIVAYYDLPVLPDRE